MKYQKLTTIAMLGSLALHGCGKIDPYENSRGVDLPGFGEEVTLVDYNKDDLVDEIRLSTSPPRFLYIAEEFPNQIRARNTRTMPQGIRDLATAVYKQARDLGKAIEEDYQKK